MIEQCTTSWGYQHGECAVWLTGDMLCDRPAGHYPDTFHRGHAPSGECGVDGKWGWIDFAEVKWVGGSRLEEVNSNLRRDDTSYVPKHRLQ